jgi:peptidyl-prolyl cis-trans isomerase D
MMLQKMRDRTQTVAFKVLLGIIVFVLAVFGFGAINLFGSGDPDMARVNGDSITQSMLVAESERERRRLAAQLGEQFDPTMIDPVRMQEVVLERMISRTLMAEAADQLGVGSSDAQVAASVRRNPNFEVDGRFQEARFRMVAQALGYSPQAFIEETRELLALEQLQTGIMGTAFETEQELRGYARLLGQRRDIAYLPFGVDRFVEQAQVSDEDVALRYEENRAEYMTEETVDVEWIELTAQSLADAPGIEVSEDEVRAAYEADRAAAPAGDERRSRHILLTVNDSRDAAAAEAEIRALQARIEAGESFADVARTASEDPGSAPQGGDLGFAGRGVFDPAFEEALFALDEPGALSGPVRTEFGVHLIQLEEVRTVEYPDFETARSGIEERLRRAQADSLFDERVRELDNLAFERPNDLAGVAAEFGLEARRLDGVKRGEGADPFGSEALREAVFAADVLDKGFNTPVVEAEPGRAVVARVVQRHPAEPIPLAEVADELRERMVSERAAELAEEARAAAQARVEAGESVAEVARAYGLNWQRFEAVTRGAADIPRDILDAAFRLDRPAEGDKSVGAARLSGGGGAVVTVTRVQDGTLEALTQEETAELRRLVAERVARLDFGGFYETLERNASIRRID